MAGFASEANIVEIADFLKDKKSQGQRPGLLLCQRTGPLFSQDNLYKILRHRILTADDLPKLLRQDSSSPDDLKKLKQHIDALDNLSVLVKFRACYNLLSKHFSESGIHNILLSTLAPLRFREEDELMARLIKAGYFSTIITTNIDTLLEDACIFLGMKESTDYQTIIYGSNSSIKSIQSVLDHNLIYKIFGDLESLKYKTVGNEFDLKADKVLKKFLESEQVKDMLVLGYDPTWDRPIEYAFLETGGMLWHVNEEQPWQNTYPSNVLKRRESKYLVGPHWNYINFMRELSDLLEGGASREAQAEPSSPSLQSQDQITKKAFISYSHRDLRHMERLLTHLRGYLYTESAENVLDIWVDTRIPTGSDWKEEIRKALASARIAILLISADFLASDFIRDYELPVLVEAAKKEEIKLLPIILGPSAFERTPLYRYQVAENSFSRPLTKMKAYERDVIWKKLAEQIVDILDLHE